MNIEKNIAIIGVGNAGGQIAKLAETKYPTLFDSVYINTSEADLSMINTDSVLKFKIGENDDDIEGTGKNRTKMRKYLRQDIGRIIGNEDFQDIIMDKKYVFVCMSAGGGTGSGAGPIFLDILTSAFEDPHFILLTVLPSLQSSLIEQVNTMECMDEIFKTLRNVSYMIYDNETRIGNSPTKILETVNDEIVEDLKVFTGVDNIATPYESIDSADMESIITTPGRIIVSRITSDITEKIMENQSLDKRIIKSIKDSAHAEIDYTGKVSSYGIITYFTESVNNMYNPELLEVGKYVGMPVERFNHNAINNHDDKTNFIYFIASGLGPINDRVAKCVERINDIKSMRNDELGTYKFDTSAVYDTSERGKEKKKPSGANIKFDDFFTKFDNK